jgi:hypothetical protein
VTRIDQLRRQLLEVALEAADQVASMTSLQPGDVVGAGHAAIHDPDPLCLAVARFHRADDLLDGGDVDPVAGEHLVAERHPVSADDEPNADLLAVRSVVPAVAAPGHGVALGLAFEERAGDVVKQQLVVECKELAEPVLEMLLERPLVRQQLIQRPVQLDQVCAGTSPRRCAARWTARTAVR